MNPEIDVEDPDYLDPAELRRRAEVSGGAGVMSSRPLVHRPGAGFQKPAKVTT